MKFIIFDRVSAGDGMAVAAVAVTLLGVYLLFKANEEE